MPNMAAKEAELLPLLPLLWKWGVAASISSRYRMQMTCKFLGQIHHGRCHSPSQHFFKNYLSFFNF